MLGNSIRVAELVRSIQGQCRVLGKINGFVQRALPLDQADSESLSFYRFVDPQASYLIKTSQAKVVVCSLDVELHEEDFQHKTLIQVTNPRLTFSRLLSKYFLDRTQPSIHPSSVISENAKIGDRVHIGPQCYIGDCEIGDYTFIEGQVYINSATKIGRSVIIRPGVIIGTEAISFTRNEAKELEWFPQLGGVVIEDNVEIGAQTVIARGPLPQNDTVIGEGTKLDIQVEVGHGVRIGKHCIIVGHTIMCGRVKIGDYTQISGQVCIREGITIGNRVLVGMGAVVVKDIPDSTVAIGFPAKPIRGNVV
jgi:UDP-3-O-[3-hydroxymyristoyl] glucosamine N-acyltransferase